MKSLLALTLAIFIVAVFPHAFASNNLQLAYNEGQHSTPHRDCVIKYLGCKDSCDYYDDAATTAQCKSQCDRNFRCRPDSKQHKVRTLFD